MLVLVAAYFPSVYPGEIAMLAIPAQHIERVATHIQCVPEFRFYAVSGGTDRRSASANMNLRTHVNLQ